MFLLKYNEKYPESQAWCLIYNDLILNTDWFFRLHNTYGGFSFETRCEIKIGGN